MDTTNIRTPERVLIIGCTSFAGLDSIAWTAQVVPNIPDYDLIVISVPHIGEAFLRAVRNQFLEEMRKALVRFLHSGGKMIILTSHHITIERSSYPHRVSNIDWCPISYETPNEIGKSIIWRSQAYSSYLKKMTEWSFYLTVSNDDLTSEITEFYGSKFNTRYEVPIQAYLENRYSRILAGQCLIEVRKERKRNDGWGHVHEEYPTEPDCVTGIIVILPLIDGVSPEEALLDILKEEVGYSLKSPAPDWAQEIEIPFVSELQDQIVKAQATIAKEEQNISTIVEKIDNLTAFRCLLYSSGTELEDVVRKSFELLGATVKPAKYSQEEYILEVDNDEFLMEVKGVSKSISLTHLRQLNDYLLKYQEETGKECKGILLGNAWRNMPPDMRNAEETPVFPDNVVKRAEKWQISLVSSQTLFDAVIKVLREEAKAKDILGLITIAEGIANI